jgi:hypothetical protein
MRRNRKIKKGRRRGTGVRGRRGIGGDGEGEK